MLRRRRNPELPEGTLTLKDAEKVLRLLGVELETADKVEFLHGLEVEAEHAETVGGDWRTVGLIVLDHLGEDRAYYRKLKKAMREHYDEMAERQGWMAAHEAGRTRYNPLERENSSGGLTSAEFAAIETILANGGKVIAHMGRKKKGAVNKKLLFDMQDRGLVRILGSGYIRSGPVRVDVEVRAVGCVAFNAEQGRRALKDDPTTVDLLCRRNPSDTSATSIRLSPAALSALEIYVTDPAHVEQRPLDEEDEGAIRASREILEGLKGQTLQLPDGSDPEQCWAWHARLSYGAESAMESGDYGAAKSLNALAGKCVDVLRKHSK